MRQSHNGLFRQLNQVSINNKWRNYYRYYESWARVLAVRSLQELIIRDRRIKPMTIIKTKAVAMNRKMPFCNKRICCKSKRRIDL